MDDPVNQQHAHLTERILACAFDVHTRVGPGLLESTYKVCLLHRLAREGLTAEDEVPIAIEFDGQAIGTGYRADVVVEKKVLLELKAVDALLPIHVVQALTYLKHSKLDVALLINFNVQSLRQGIRRLYNPTRPCDRTLLTPFTRSSRL